ncbi:restriction endonuclease subunit S [Marinomonas sp. 15G1-11]|uniref:Restriction endonuclease subunit S n=1 Tax=Marinomonas phaeophyticola TaxID=3004091 RepID=A0ABT4JVZ7_9GAMM|nr:restriction endonuclease subunit S [Marinomonas sp. 15G1-11]MCZ2722396.1 restriction endonuclease subunit S [Marinomonas sp. 15G1-11]
MTWPMVKLGGLVIAHYGKALKKENRNESGIFDVYGSSGLVGKHDGALTYESTLIVGRKGSVGKIVWAENGGWVIDTAYYLQVLQPEKLDLRYLFYALKKADLRSRTITTSIPGLNRDDFYGAVIPLPPLEEQKRIAAILDKADAIRRKRQQAIQLADDFLRSVFLDMFGDPVTNPKGWEVKNIVELASSDKYSLKRGPFGGALKKEAFVDSGYLVYEQYHALNNDFTFARYFIDEEKYQELKAFDVGEGDIIISCSGVNLGRLAIVPKGSPKGIINQALLKVKLDESKMLNEMFVSIFTHPNFKREFFGDNRGSGVPNFPPMSTFKEFGFIVPPLEMQQQYISLVHKVEQLKVKVKNSCELSDTEFNSLSQKAFAGEL